MPNYDYYEILEVDRAATTQVITRAYRELAKRYHPDSGGSPRIMQMLNEAYDVLSDPEARALYDAEEIGASDVQHHTDLPPDMILPEDKRVFGVSAHRYRPRDAVSGLEVSYLYGTKGAQPVSVAYMTQGLHQVPFDLHLYFRTIKGLCSSDHHRWLRHYYKEAITEGLVSARDLLSRGDTGLFLVPSSGVQAPNLLVWFRAAGPPVVPEPPSSGQLALSGAAWLEYLARSLPKSQLDTITARLAELLRSKPKSA